MKDGYIALMGIWCLFIFVWSGWFDGRYPRVIQLRWWLLGMLALTWVAYGWRIEFFGGEIRWLPYFSPLCVTIYLWIKEAEIPRLHIFSASLLIGVAVFVMQMLFRVDPVLLFTNEKYLLASFMVLLLFVGTQKTTHQFLLLAFGLAFSDLCFQFYLYQQTGSFSIGSSFYQDVWWLSLYGLLIMHLVLDGIKKPYVLSRKHMKARGVARVKEIK